MDGILGGEKRKEIFVYSSSMEWRVGIWSRLNECTTNKKREYY